MCAKRLLQQTPLIDSLITPQDTMAVGAITCIKELGLRIPQDIQVVGIGDSSFGKIIEPKLTTVHFSHKQQYGGSIMLADLMENEEGIRKEIKMGCEIVLRNSHREN